VTDLPEEAVQLLAAKLYEDYDNLYLADHLTWRDFRGQAREQLALVAPLLAATLANLVGTACPWLDDGDHPCDFREAARVVREAFAESSEAGR
jgi:hypothetical protein